MPSNPFAKANFNPALLSPLRKVVFDDSGVLDDGGISGAVLPSYTNQAYTDANLEGMFASAGFGDIVFDIDTQFADATYTTAINSAISSNGQTTYYVDHGIQGTAGSDVVQDISGNNVVNTGDGADLILVGAGDDFIDAGRGDDVVVARGGNDVVKLGRGDDWAYLGQGDDMVKAGGGHDTVLGMGGDDWISGQGGRDDLSGGDGADTILGGGGSDTIDGGADDDILTGGRGRDDFIFHQGTGSDVVTDFEAGRDDLVIDMATGLTSFAQVQSAATQNGTDLVIALGGGDQITLEGIALADLSASDFIFV